MKRAAILKIKKMHIPLLLAFISPSKGNFSPLFSPFDQYDCMWPVDAKTAADNSLRRRLHRPSHRTLLHRTTHNELCYYRYWYLLSFVACCHLTILVCNLQPSNRIRFHPLTLTLLLLQTLHVRTYVPKNVLLRRLVGREQRRPWIH